MNFAAESIPQQGGTDSWDVSLLCYHLQLPREPNLQRCVQERWAIAQGVSFLLIFHCFSHWSSPFLNPNLHEKSFRPRKAVMARKFLPELC